MKLTPGTTYSIAYAEIAQQLAGGSEDILHDIYLSFLENPPASETAARTQALEVKRRSLRPVFDTLFNQRSMDAPLGTSEEGEAFSLHSVLHSEQSESLDTLVADVPLRRNRIRERYLGPSDLPPEVKAALRARSPNLSYVDAIRSALSLPVSGKTLERWLAQEDQVIRVHYPNGGALVVQALLPHRKISAIRTRAYGLHVKNKGLNPLTPDWLSLRQCGKLLGKAPQTIRGWCQQGIIKSAKLAHNGKHKFFVVHLDEILALKTTPPVPKPRIYQKNPYPPVLWAAKIHYLVGEDEDGWKRGFCKRSIPIHPFGIHPQHWNKKPTCKVCLAKRDGR